MRRRALIIGIGAYDADPLDNAVRDATEVAEILGKRGFKCILLNDASGVEIEAALAEFDADASIYEMSLIYFSGHAVEHHGAGYILPRDFVFPVKASSLDYMGLSTVNLLKPLARKPGTNVLVLDCCRNWPDLGSGEAFKLTAQLDEIRQREGSWENVMVVYSTSSGDTASDGRAGAGSTFCNAFCSLLQRHDLTLDDCFKEVAVKVVRESIRAQRPWSYSSLLEGATFSDIRRFALVHSYKVPLKADVPLWMSDVGRVGEVTVTGGSRSVFAALLSGPRQVQSPRSNVDLVASCVFPNGVAVLDEDGVLLVGINTEVTSIKTKSKHPRGIFYSSAHLIVYGLDGWGIYFIEGNIIVEKSFRRPRWAVHTGVAIAPAKACLAGGYGNVIKIDWSEGIAEKKLAALPSNVNSLSVTSNNELLCGGDSGMLVRLDLAHGKITADYRRSEKLTTIAARWQSLVQYINDNEPIMRFLTSPETLPSPIVEMLERRMDQNRIMCVDVNPKLPLVACGSNEGIMDIIDARDGQTVQRIDVEAGRGLPLEGLRFINEAHIVTLSSTGVVRHYMSAPVTVDRSAPFLTEEQDRMLISGEFDLND